ncbi:MAG: hypothetical protein GY950_24170, partial [bacterium]|nr:hypothetical protein [bacterium]
MRDCNIAVNNINEAFAAVKNHGGLLTWNKGTTSFQPGGHLQSIQRLSKNRGQNVYTYVISASSSDHSFFFIIEKSNAVLRGEDHNPGDAGNLLVIEKLLNKPFTHAGGIQMVGDILVIGVEDDDEKDKSKVLFYNLEDPANP